MTAHQDRLFDVYLFVDWSASNAPTGQVPRKDAVWAGEGSWNDPPAACYYPTRDKAFEKVLGRLKGHVAAGRRVLVGFDFPYGYPTGFADAIGAQGNGPPWRRTWNALRERLEDDERNQNNRFRVASDLNNLIFPGTPGPFWGVPGGQDTDTLTRKRVGNLEYPYHLPDGNTLDMWRSCEVRLNESTRVQSVWQLFGNGSVGSQTLTGIPRVAGLRDDPELAGVSVVWPFESGFTPGPVPEGTGPFVVHVEIWPGTVEQRRDLKDPIKDRAQVLAMVEWAKEMDSVGELGGFFDVPSSLDSRSIEDCVAEEAWVLGAV